MNVSVVGAGKMGLPVAVRLASRGASVIACDKNPRVVEAIAAGDPEIEEPGVLQLLRAALEAGRMRATTDTAAAAADSDVVIVITPAVLTESREADLTNLEDASRDIARGVDAGTLVIYETTVPVGTTRQRLVPILASSGLAVGEELAVAYSPERVKSRFVLRHLDDTPKIVGGLDANAAARAAAFYADYLGAPTVDVETLEAAEFVKLAGMIYRDVNIALANQLACYAEAREMDADALLEAANTDGECALLSPGIGVGGHCTPIYPHFLIRDAERREIDASLVSTARRVNDTQPERMVGRLQHRLGDLEGTRIGVLGLGFRPDVKEHICSPTFGLDIALRSRGAEVRVHDPLYSAAELLDHGLNTWSLNDAVWKPEALVLVTAHAEYRGLDLARLRADGLRAVVDGRRFWDPGAVEGLGIEYVGPGRADEVLERDPGKGAHAEATAVSGPAG